jgi:hypothetical protein
MVERDKEEADRCAVIGFRDEDDYVDLESVSQISWRFPTYLNCWKTVSFPGSIIE